MKAKRIVGIIKYLSSFLPLTTLDQMYKALVRSHLDYCDTIHHMPAINNQINLSVTLTSLMETVERTQYQAALAITGAWQGSNRSKLYEELGWESLSDRRWCNRILQIHKIKKISEINYLLTANFCIDVKILILFIKCNTSRYKNSFFPDAIISWNNIITNFQNVPSFTSLKAHILSLIRPKAKSTFGVHDPRGLRFLFQLRVDLSPLRNHKRRYNFADTLLGFVSVIKILKILAIFYLNVIGMQLKERS